MRMKEVQNRFPESAERTETSILQMLQNPTQVLKWVSATSTRRSKSKFCWTKDHIYNNETKPISFTTSVKQVRLGKTNSKTKTLKLTFTPKRKSKELGHRFNEQKAKSIQILRLNFLICRLHDPKTVRHEEISTQSLNRRNCSNSSTKTFQVGYLNSDGVEKKPTSIQRAEEKGEEGLFL